MSWEYIGDTMPCIASGAGRGSMGTRYTAGRETRHGTGHGGRR